MSVEGRISVDVLFHDKDGTNAINVLTLGSSIGYDSGFVAMVSGTCSETPTAIDLGQTGYRNASGELIGLSAFRVALKASGNGAQLWQANGDVRIRSSVDQVNMTEIDEQEYLYVSGQAGTSNYTVLIYSQ